MAQRSAQVANWLRALGVARGDRVLLLMPNEVALWETMLACMKLGAVIVPTTTLVSTDDLADRFDRGAVKHVICTASATAKFDVFPGAYTRIVVGAAGGLPAGWQDYAAYEHGIDHVRARRPDPGRRPAVPVLHLGHHVQAQAGAAQPPELSGGPPVDDVLDRPEARRRALEHQLARLGQARLELLLRAVERRRDDLHLQLRALQRARRAGRAGQEQGHLAVRAAHRVAHADAAGSRPGTRPRCASWWAPASRSTPR